MRIFCCKIYAIYYSVLQLVNFFSGHFLRKKAFELEIGHIRCSYIGHYLFCYNNNNKKTAHKAAQTFQKLIQKKQPWEIGKEKEQERKSRPAQFIYYFDTKLLTHTNFRLFFSLLYFFSCPHGLSVSFRWLAGSFLCVSRIEIIIPTTFAQHHKSCWQSPPGLISNGGNGIYYTHTISYMGTVVFIIILFVLLIVVTPIYVRPSPRRNFRFFPAHSKPNKKKPLFGMYEPHIRLEIDGK